MTVVTIADPAAAVAAIRTETAEATPVEVEAAAATRGTTTTTAVVVAAAAAVVVAEAAKAAAAIDAMAADPCVTTAACAPGHTNRTRHRWGGTTYFFTLRINCSEYSLLMYF